MDTDSMTPANIHAGFDSQLFTTESVTVILDSHLATVLIVQIVHAAGLNMCVYV